MVTNARKESRWKKQVQSANDADGDRRREVESFAMVRGPRPPNHTRRQVRVWMRANAVGYDGATQLAEAADAALRLPLGAMDDECHWIWDEAADAEELSENL